MGDSRPLTVPAVRHLATAVAYYYPFTVLGTAVLAASFYLAGSAFGTGNPYEFVLSGAAFFVLFILAIDGRLQAYRFKDADLEWDTSTVLVARERRAEQTLYSGEVRPHYFYRLHVRVTGRLQAGNNASLFVLREVSSAAGGEIPVPMTLPVCGALYAQARMAIRDVFGLSRARVGLPQARTLTVRPAPLSDSRAPRVEVTMGYDTTQKQKSSDEEKYYMREYMPGDRMKDINWKASSRLNDLITRISPLTQEQTHLLHIEFRHYRPAAPESLDSMLHLNYAKGWLLAFLRGLKQQQPQYNFRVVTAGHQQILESMDDIEAFSRALATVFYHPGADHPPPEGAGEIFVFTTAFDRDLASFLGQSRAAKIHLFRTARARREQTADQLSVPVCLFGGYLPMALPTLWAVRREAALPAAALPDNLLRHDQPVEVTYLCH